MNLQIENEIAMVAAGSKGIGFAVAQLLIEEGCRVSICSRSQESVDDALARLGVSAIGIACDVGNLSDLESWHRFTIEKLGSPTILFTNTGGPPAGAVGDMTDDQWQQGFDSTVMNVVRLTRLVAPGMIKAGWGRLIHLTSLVAKEPSNALPISSTLRAGLMALTRVQSNELAPHGITVNSVLPGHTVTDRQMHLAELNSARQGISIQEALDKQAGLIPAGRMAQPNEIAAAVLFLCSRQAGFITGVNLLVDGGITKGLG